MLRTKRTFNRWQRYGSWIKFRDPRRPVRAWALHWCLSMARFDFGVAITGLISLTLLRIAFLWYVWLWRTNRFHSSRECDEMLSRKTTMLIEFQVNDTGLTKINGGEVTNINLHSCSGPEFVLHQKLTGFTHPSADYGGTYMLNKDECKAVYIYGFGIPFFIDDHEKNGMKWGLWIVHGLLLCAIYGIILFMHHSKWRERLPARPAFYNYISTMLVLNCIALFALLLVENGAGLGFWVLDLMTVSYHALYLPFLYVTFLADFFQEDDMRLENVYYSEMKHAGFFDADWD